MKKSKEIIRPNSEKSKEISLKPAGVVAVGVYLKPSLLMERESNLQRARG